MILDNRTVFDVTTLTIMGPADQPIMAIIAKGTYVFSMDKIALAAEQVPIAHGDTFYNEQEGGGIRYESDLVPYKPRTDVVLSGKAYAPDKAAAQDFDVMLKVGPLKKRLKIFGRRIWNHDGVLRRRYICTQARPFVIHPIRYNDAFGGMDETTGEYCDQNLIGKGFYSNKSKATLTGRPLPRVEDPHRLIKTPKDHPPPAGFGFYHRTWQPRAAFAGTYDNTWRSERSPHRPIDFDFRYHNGAHPDLQVNGYLGGHEKVALTNLTPEGHIQFALPGVRPHCRIKRIDRDGIESIDMNLDTLFIEPDERSICLVWRGAVRLDELSDTQIELATITTNQGDAPQVAG